MGSKTRAGGAGSQGFGDLEGPFPSLGLAGGSGRARRASPGSGPNRTGMAAKNCLAEGHAAGAQGTPHRGESAEAPRALGRGEGRVRKGPPALPHQEPHGLS